MTHTEVYILLGVGLFITGFGGLVIYREIKHNFPMLPGRNVLTRRHYDIELQDVNHIQSNLRDIDIDISSLPEFPTSQAFVNQMPIRWDRYSLPRFSHLSENTATGNRPPGYSQLTNNFINCSLENNINLDFVWVILFFIFILIITLLIRKYGKEKLLLIIIFILNLKFGIVGYKMSILIPFSFFEIDFRDSFEWELDSYRDKPMISYLKIQTLTEDIIKLLNSLKDDENYSMTPSLIPSYKEWKYEKRNLSLLSEPIIINKESDPILITQFIMDSLDKNIFDISWLLNDSSINRMDPQILIVTDNIKVKI